MRRLSVQLIRKFNLLLLLFAGASLSLSAQEDWANYVTMKNDKVMSISLDLGLDLNRPNYQNLMVIGGRFRNCMPNGFPGDEGLREVFALSDSVASTLERLTRIRLAGFITYQCMAFDVFYVKDTVGLRDALSDMVRDHFPGKSLYLDIKSDQGWLYYRSFLYPGSFSSEFLIDQEYLTDLVLQGDDLQQPRRIYHWFYFKTLKRRNSMSDQLKKLNFSLDSIAYVRERFNPYQLTVSRKDSVVPGAIYELTSMLQKLSYAMKAEYDGWSTRLITADQKDSGE